MYTCDLHRIKLIISDSLSPSSPRFEGDRRLPATHSLFRGKELSVRVKKPAESQDQTLLKLVSGFEVRNTAAGRSISIRWMIFAVIEVKGTSTLAADDITFQ
ncbi:hypothetical protein Ancab_021312 [Ancistrocladus abbreviatus]